jgi:diguanylate cyclase (GGDEF)-like protein/PAS domain S-box-containing protein
LFDTATVSSSLLETALYKNSPDIEHAVSRSPSYQRFRRRLMFVSLGMVLLAILVISRVIDVSPFACIGILLMLVLMLVTCYVMLRAHERSVRREMVYRDLYDTSRATEAKLRHSEHHLRLIADNLPVLIAYVDRDERFVYANKNYELIFDIQQRLIPGSLVVDVVGADVYLASKAHLRQALDGTAVKFERVVWHQGAQRWHSVSYVPDRNDDGTIAGLFAMVEDITDRKRAEENRLLSSLVYESTSEGMMILAPDGTILDVNASFTRLSGYSQAEVCGKHLSDIAAAVHDEAFFNDVRRTVAKTGEWQGEVWNRRKGGDDYLIALKLNTVYQQDGQPFRRFALFSDITKKKAIDDLIWQQANFDNLTGLPNRHMFYEQLRMEMRKTDRSLVPMALIFIDLDRFKEVNDTLGHAQGDALLAEAAQRLRACVRASDTVARLGGDEFTIIVGDVTNSADVARIAALILECIIQPFLLGDQQALVSASIGITLYPADGDDVDALVRNADHAMYAAKALGRNRFQYFTACAHEAS